MMKWQDRTASHSGSGLALEEEKEGLSLKHERCKMEYRFKCRCEGNLSWEELLLPGLYCPAPKYQQFSIHNFFLCFLFSPFSAFHLTLSYFTCSSSMQVHLTVVTFAVITLKTFSHDQQDIHTFTNYTLNIIKYHMSLVSSQLF